MSGVGKVLSDRQREIISRTESHVKDVLRDDSTGHDWWHIARVRKMALAIGRAEGEDVDLYVVELAALLHDISDYKFNGGDLEKGTRVSFEWLSMIGESEGTARRVAEIVDTTSFKGAGVSSVMSTVEGKAVQDADYLDAMGAIGIGRAFAYGGYKGQPMYDPDIASVEHRSRDEYIRRNGTTINHFYEKLLLLKDRMNTEAGRMLANKRHAILEEFLDQFMVEWDVRDL